MYYTFSRDEKTGWANAMEKGDVLGAVNILKASLSTSQLQRRAPTFCRGDVPFDVSDHLMQMLRARLWPIMVNLLAHRSSRGADTYGELTAPFLSGVLGSLKRPAWGHGTLEPSPLEFVDLGSGIGNLVFQASLEVGANSKGIELDRGLSDIAERMLGQWSRSCHQWGLEVGSVELVCGDMTTDSRMCEWIWNADLVVVNNLCFHDNIPCKSALAKGVSSKFC